MKLEGLRIFHQQLLTELAPESVTSEVFYFYEGKWLDLMTELPCAEHLVRHLEKAKLETVAHHAASSLDAWFYLEATHSVVRMTFSQSPQLATRRRYRDRLKKVQESASNAYKVSHNPLTQLLSRDAFRAKLATAIVEIQEPDGPGAEVQESGIPRALAVLALDIDHFKQVNDTWGHLYGDCVLKAFGRRLEQCAERIRSQGVGRPAVFLGHPSGEEFLVTLHANAVRDQFVDWANDFRKAISDVVLPTEAEWDWLITSGGGALTPPALQERAVTTSIGLALHHAVSSSDLTTDSVSDLLDRADTALYRAKAAGRNQVTSFDEILSSCGRVLEQDANTGVVAIDIGSNVGVAIGQEFKVFLPMFTGKTKFLLNDGRTKRTLGSYPRVESARVVVFNAQPEISFAFVAHPTDPMPTLELGSHLEAIPAGSIGHLLPSSSKYFPAAPSSVEQGASGDLQAFIKDDAKTGSPFALVVRLTKDAEYLRKYGSVALNQALAQLYRGAQLSFRAAKTVELLDRASIGVAGSKAAYDESKIGDFVERMASELPELGIVAGVFCDADREASSANGQAKLDATNAVEFARFAASDAGRTPDARVRHFGYAVASSVLQSLRESRSFDVAYADFDRLRNLGVESAALFNLGGLIAGSLGLRKQALEHYASAMAKDPNKLVYKSNYATAALRLGEIEPALSVLNAVPMQEINRLRTVHRFGFFTYARLLARAKLAGSAMFNGERFSQIANEALTMPEYENSQDLTVIRDALSLQ